MDITEYQVPTHERVLRVSDANSGLTGYIALHSTRAGPAAGGLRMRPYGSEDEALRDVLRLSAGMTSKNAAAGLPLGGGKAVIIGDPAKDKTPGLLRAMGRAVQSLGGRYWTAEDMGMSPADMEILAEETDYVAGRGTGAFASGDPSPVTARGIFNAIGVTARHAFGSDDLAGKTIAVQGLGHVGQHLCALLAGAGARLVVADLNDGAVAAMVKTHGARAVPAKAILGTEADILAPCAIGGVLNETTIPAQRVRAVAGGANNQLASDADADRLHERGILYAPDYVANCGGIINVATEILRVRDRKGFVAEKLAASTEMMDRILTRAAERGISPHRVAEEVIAERLAGLPDAA